MTTKMISLRIPSTLFDEIEELAKRNKLSRTDLIREVLERAIEKDRRSNDLQRATRFAGAPP